MGIAGALGAAALALVAGAREVHAVDGVVEINQAKANAGGVTAGDAAAFPVTISAPGSYRLTGNLTVPGGVGTVDVNAVEITADDVTLDLGGFTISCRRNTLPASPCSGAGGTGDGILLGGDRNRVENGRIRDMADDGVVAGVNGFFAIDGVEAGGNAGDGLRVGLASRVQVFRSAFLDNGAAGIRASQSSRVFVRDTTTADNGETGVVIESLGIVWAAESLLHDEEVDFQAGVRVLGCVVFGAARLCPDDL